jgi:hypothetical protein
MFIFRWLSNILAPIGIILTVLIAYFAANPLRTSPQKNLELSSVLNCNSQTYESTSKYLNDEEQLKLKNLLGAASPIELVNEFAFGSVSQSLVKPIGSKTKLNISYCNVEEDQTTALSLVESYLKTQSKMYQYGSVDEFIDKINSIPFQKFSTSDIKVPSTFVRSNYCNRPTNKADLYLFSIIPGITTKSTVIMFNMSFENDPDALYYHKYSGNIIESVQYIKSKLYCNGR